MPRFAELAADEVGNVILRVSHCDVEPSVGSEGDPVRQRRNLGYFYWTLPSPSIRST